MRYRRSGQRHSTPDRSFASQWGHEATKEGSGTLVQQLGAGLGGLVGLAASRWGLPPAAVTIAGVILGHVVSIAGKGLVTTILDRRKEARSADGDPFTSDAGRSTRPPAVSGIRARYAGHRRTSTANRRQSIRPTDNGNTSGATTGSYLNHLRRILDEIETQQARLANIANAMRASQLGLAHLLTGGRSDRTQEIYTWTELTRSNIEEATVLTHHATKSLKAYLASL